MANNLKRQAMEDLEEVTAKDDVLRGPKLANLTLDSAAQTEASCSVSTIPKEVPHSH